MDREQQMLPPHVLIYPLPAQGHVNSMLKLAELLCLGGFHVTFLVSIRTHHRLDSYTNIQSRFHPYPGFRLQILPDCVNEDPNYSGDRLMVMIDSLKETTPFLHELLVSRSENRQSVTCIIADGVLGFVIDIAKDLGIPIIYFRTISPGAFWTYFCLPRLVEARELPFNGSDLDVRIKSVPGMEGFLRRRDLPSFCRSTELSGRGFEMVFTETQRTTEARALILNSFEDLDAPMFSQIRMQCPNIYPIGPLHVHLKTRLAAKANSQSTSSNSFWEEDKSCMTWLDEQPPKSVIYVSFGSITIMTRDQLMEFWHGLVNSGKRFLWVIRPDLIGGMDEECQTPTELDEGTKARGYMVGWAPQEEVLAHSAIGGFLTHSGWNSTLESVVEGVPMICWPYFADQQVNSRFVAEVWKLGLDMKDICDRVTVERMVNELIDVRKEEFRQSAYRMAKLAKKSVSEGGSSYCNLDRLIEDIRLMSVQPCHT